MVTAQELGGHSLAELAVMCQRVADDVTVHELTSREASSLKREWATLIARETPPTPEFAEHKKIEAERRKLRKRMAQFLAGAI
jgi:hypothetical protein